jgi:hypothetical protein
MPEARPEATEAGFVKLLAGLKMKSEAAFLI